MDVTVHVSDSYGNPTHLSAVKERCPAPIDERVVLCANRVRYVGQEVIESPWPGLQPGALPFKLLTQSVTLLKSKSPVIGGTGPGVKSRGCQASQAWFGCKALLIQ